MAVSLAFGVLFATFVTPVLVPCGYMIVEDLKNAAAQAALGGASGRRTDCGRLHGVRNRDPARALGRALRSAFVQQALAPHPTLVELGQAALPRVWQQRHDQRVVVGFGRNPFGTDHGRATR